MAVTSRAVSHNKWPSPARWPRRPAAFILAEPAESIQRNVIKDVARFLRHLAKDRAMPQVLVARYFYFAGSLADRIA